MSDTREETLAAVLAEHSLVLGANLRGPWFRCLCGDRFFSSQDHRAHVAAALVAALDATPDPVVAETITEWGFLYDGKPEWSTHAYVRWSRDAAWHYRREAGLWRVSTLVGGLIYRERTSYRDSVGDWQPEVPAEHSSHEGCADHAPLTDDQIREYELWAVDALALLIPHTRMHAIASIAMPDLIAEIRRLRAEHTTGAGA